MLDKVANFRGFEELQGTPPTAASALMAVLQVLEESEVRYVVLHGYERFPETFGSDVDLCVDRSVSDADMCRMLSREAGRIGARVIKCENGAIVLSGESFPSERFFLKLDIERDYALNGFRFVSGTEVLAARRQHGTFHVPSPAHQVAGYLANCIVKAKFDSRRTGRLASLYLTDPAGCDREIARLWPDTERKMLRQALSGDRWDEVVANAQALRESLVERLRKIDPAGGIARAVQKFSGRLRRFIKPRGVSVVVLGPDGAGKSSTTEAIGGAHLLPVFEGSACWGFVPPMHRLIRSQGSTSQPHALPARSLAGSLLKAAYWLAFSFIMHPRTHLMKARGGLVLYDRHFIDILVDAKRYRYKGPAWVLRAIWAVMPKPDLVVLLDAPAEVIQARKKELTVEETSRQLQAYRQLVETLPNGIILGANRPFPEVVDALNGIVLNFYEKRARSRDLFR